MTGDAILEELTIRDGLMTWIRLGGIRISSYNFDFSDHLRLAIARNSSSMCSGFGPARGTCTFPESDLIWSSCMGSGFGPARASCAFSGSDPAWSYVLTGMLTPDVTVDEFTSPCSLSPLGAATSVSLSVHSESVVDEDSWITFSDTIRECSTCSSVTMTLPLPTTSSSLGVVSDTGSLIVTPPTGARPCGRKEGSKLSLIAHSMSASAPSPSPFLERI
ncbi:hypothetical protein Tco_0367988 [Tanacetum coccineum]